MLAYISHWLYYEGPEVKPIKKEGQKMSRAIIEDYEDALERLRAQYDYLNAKALQDLSAGNVGDCAINSGAALGILQACEILGLHLFED